MENWVIVLIVIGIILLVAVIAVLIYFFYKNPKESSGTPSSSGSSGSSTSTGTPSSSGSSGSSTSTGTPSSSGSSGSSTSTGTPSVGGITINPGSQGSYASDFISSGWYNTVDDNFFIILGQPLATNIQKANSDTSNLIEVNSLPTKLLSPSGHLILKIIFNNVLPNTKYNLTLNIDKGVEYIDYVSFNGTTLVNDVYLEKENFSLNTIITSNSIGIVLLINYLTNSLNGSINIYNVNLTPV